MREIRVLGETSGPVHTLKLGEPLDLVLTAVGPLSGHTSSLPLCHTEVWGLGPDSAAKTPSVRVPRPRCGPPHKADAHLPGPQTSRPVEPLTPGQANLLDIQ